ncbi:MAG TPA: hypothetical protein VGS19_24675 [Streptosporangiaceae bacterium]|nr:hypothetical protein [Streptosporangiaceae bacterium]
MAGLGASPHDVVINGAVDVFNQCVPTTSTTNCLALTNFWRSLSNLTINVMASPSLSSCQGGAEFWATSQAAPVRRVDVNGTMSLDDYCTTPSYSSGGEIADSVFSGGKVVSGSQQQFFVRNSNIDSWSNGVWNQVFSGDVGAPPQSFGQPGAQPYTTLASSPVTQEEPLLYTDSSGGYQVFVPSLQHNSAGASWANGPTAGTSIPIGHFFIAHPSDSASVINAALSRGQNLLLTPGIYSLDQTLDVKHANTVVLGLGFPTLVPANGLESMQVADVGGVKLSGVIFDAGTQNSRVLLKVGTKASVGRAGTPDLVQDVFFRIGGATPGRATTSLVVNSSYTILDDVWSWRADHGNGVGWTQNVSHTGLVVNGNHVTAYGLFVEHSEKSQVIWNGQGGTVIFFQNEMPYEVPSQSAWMENPTTDGYPAFRVASKVTSFQGYGMGSYCYFNQGLAIFATNAFQAPDKPGVQFHDLLTVFLNKATTGGIDHVINGAGGSATNANPDVGVDVVSYP